MAYNNTSFIRAINSGSFSDFNAATNDILDALESENLFAAGYEQDIYNTVARFSCTYKKKGNIPGYPIIQQAVNDTFNIIKRVVSSNDTKLLPTLNGIGETQYGCMYTGFFTRNSSTNLSGASAINVSTTHGINTTQTTPAIITPNQNAQIDALAGTGTNAPAKKNNGLIVFVVVVVLFVAAAYFIIKRK